MQFILSDAQPQATGLVVGSYDNQSFFRVLLVELIGDLYRIVQIDNFFKNGSRVITVASPVYFAAFYHKEETFIVSFCQERNGAFRYFR